MTFPATQHAVFETDGLFPLHRLVRFADMTDYGDSAPFILATTHCLTAELTTDHSQRIDNPCQLTNCRTRQCRG